MNTDSGDVVAVEPQDDYETISGAVEVEKPVEAPKEPEPDEDHEDEEPDHSERKPKRGGFQKKIAQRDQLIADLQRQLAEKAAPVSKQDTPSEKSDAAPVEPNEDDFHTFADFQKAERQYYRDLAKYEANNAVESYKKSTQKQSQEEKSQQEFQGKLEAYNQKATEAKEVYKDFQTKMDAFFNSGYQTPLVESVILDSEMGADVGYYIANNPDVAEKLAGLGLVALNKEIGRIEARLELDKSEKAVVRTKTPPPISPIKNNASSTKALEDMDYDEYKLAMEAKERARR